MAEQEKISSRGRENLTGINFHLTRAPNGYHDMWVERRPSGEFDLIDSATLRFIRRRENMIVIGLRKIGEDSECQERFNIVPGQSYIIDETGTTFDAYVIKRPKGLPSGAEFHVDHPTGIKFVTNKGREVVKKPR